MRSDLSLRVKNHVCAAWKWSLSLLKRDWELPDYPLALREHEINPDYVGTRLKQHSDQYSTAVKRRVCDDRG